MGLKAQKMEAPVMQVLENLQQEKIGSRSEAWTSDDNDNHDDNNMSESHLNTILRPLHIIMAIFGLYNFNHINAATTTTTRKCSLSFVYRLLLFIMLLLFLVKMLVGFFYLPKEAFQFNGLFSWWLLQCLVWFVIFWWATNQTSGKLLAAFTTWRETVLPKFQEINLEYPSKTVHKSVITLLVISVSVTVFNTFGCGIHFALPVDVALYTSPFETNGFTIAAFNIFQLLASATWVIPSVYAAAVTIVVKHAFITLNQGLCDARKAASCHVPPDFQKFRVLHAHLCTLVSEYDCFLGLYYASLCISHVGQACFTLYRVIHGSMDTFQLIMYIFWLISSVAMIAFGTIFAARVNDEAHAPLDTIYYINVGDITMEKLAQINLFLSKLTGTQVGFSTCGLLVITKEFILTIAGVFLTYFAVLYTL